jgi:hypothetical protein
MLTRWKSGSLVANAQNILIGDRSGVIVKESAGSRSAAGSAFESFYELGDIQIDPSKYVGISYVELHYRDVGVACPMTLGLSNDGGKSWTNKTVTLTAGVGSGKILHTNFFQTIVGRNVSIRLYVNSATTYFEIVGMRVWLTSVGK